MDRLNLDRALLKKFGLTMGIAFLVVTFFILFRHKYSIMPTLILSAIFFILALIAPVLLEPIYIIWMRLALVLSWINTRLILLIMFYLIFTPIGLGMRLFGVDLLDRKIDKSKNSYWKKKEKREPSISNYERQF